LIPDEEDIPGGKKSKKKEKKDKEKGYAALQADSSHDEEEVPDPKYDFLTHSSMK